MREQQLSIEDLKADLMDLLVEGESEEKIIDYITRVALESEDVLVFTDLVEFVENMNIDLNLPFFSVILHDEDLEDVLNYI